MDASFKFIKGANDKFEKIAADDESGQYELKRAKNKKQSRIEGAEEKRIRVVFMQEHSKR